MTWLFDYDLTLYGHDEADVLWSLDRNITRFLMQRFAWSEATADEFRKGYCAQFGTTLGGLRALHGVTPTEYFDFIHAGETLLQPKFEPWRRELLLALPGTRWVFTNARRDWAERGLQSMQIQDCFAGILDIESFAWDSKPSPSVYAEVEIRMKEKGSQLILLDDKPDNLQPALALGWRTVLVHPQCEQMQVECTAKIKHLVELPQIFSKLLTE